jgi:ferredoxin
MASENRVVQVFAVQDGFFAEKCNCGNQKDLFLEVRYHNDDMRVCLHCNICKQSCPYDAILEFQTYRKTQNEKKKNGNNKKRKREINDNDAIASTVSVRKEKEYAERLAGLLNGSMVYVPQAASFYHFSEDKTDSCPLRWRKDKGDIAIRLAIDSVLIPAVAAEGGETELLLCTNMRDSIVQESKSCLVQKDFLGLLDANQEIVGFDNGVYDFRTRTFRPPVPQDYVSFSTKTTFIPNLLKLRTHPDVIAITEDYNAFLNDVFLDSYELKDMFLHILASAYNGNKRKQLFHIWNGGTLSPLSPSLSPLSLSLSISKIQKIQTHNNKLYEMSPC